ncbi:hypothetical protein BJ912DRAFT_1026995 [Pholiota molesta]|nr:hypothetical protein BJ912DRAFT_1026995 [Pholiota molesta]
MATLRTLHTVPTPASPKQIVNLVEVGPRDGLQNEKGGIVPVDVKVELINRLVRAGAMNVEAGSFVSPKWVPQMAGTADVLKGIAQRAGVHYAVLVPNARGLTDLLALLSASDRSPPLTDEISVFVAATDAFSRANLNCSVAESLARTAPVVRAARAQGLRVRGYVSVVVACPYAGRVAPARVREVARELREMGCYEVSLGRRWGAAGRMRCRRCWRSCCFHDTFGTGVANVMAALDSGVRTIDASVGGLGGCPYSPAPRATSPPKTCSTRCRARRTTSRGRRARGAIPSTWRREKLGRESVSRAGRAIRARQQREREEGGQTEGSGA